MKSILMSIHPKWCERIFNGEKTIEVRKTAPKPPFKVVVYCTKAQTGSYKGNLYINPPKKRKEIGVADWWSERKDELSINGGYLQFNAFLAHGKVIGEFVCNTVENIPVDSEAFTFISKPACLTTDELIEYCSGKDMYGIHITAPVLYDKPRELGEFRKPCIMPEMPYCPACKYGNVQYSPDEVECASELEGASCEWLCLNSVKRPPQSYMRIQCTEEV